MRIKNNLISGFLNQFVLIAMSFILPRLYLENFGSEVNGVLSTIKQIFTYMTLLEAGVGIATLQALYDPVAKNNYKGTGKILSATHSYYIKTGIVYLSIVLLFAVFYAYIIPVNMDSNVLFTIIILNAVPSLFSYFIAAKYRILMEADGRKYVITNSDTLLQIFTNIGKILVLLLTDSLVLIQLVYCILALLQVLYLYLYAKRNYKWLDLKEEPDFTAISQKNSALIHQISGMVFNNTDILLLSILTDFKTVSIYTIYNIFFSGVQTFITAVVSSFSFAFGQMFHKDFEKFTKIYTAYEALYIMSTFIIYTLMAVFLLPLIQIYTGGINDAEYTNALLVFLFVIMNLLSNGKLPSNHVIEFSEKFKATRWHAVVEMIINLVFSVFAILKWGIVGAILGTIAALLFRGTIMIFYANRKVFGRKAFFTYKHWLINGTVFVFIMHIFFVDSFSGVSFVELLLNGIVHSVWIFALYLAVNLIFNKETFKILFELLKGRHKV